jgi:hypothetical protein
MVMRNLASTELIICMYVCVYVSQWVGMTVCMHTQICIHTPHMCQLLIINRTNHQMVKTQQILLLLLN